MAKYAIGLDFGTLSARCVLVDVRNGEEIASGVCAYPHGVIDRALPCGVSLEDKWALQDPQDYLHALCVTVGEVLNKSGVDSGDIIGIGTDFTACTILPVKADGAPLCTIKPYDERPHAYAKLWKHHAAQQEANDLNEIAKRRGEKWLKRYGGRVSAEFLFPKIWQVLKEDEEIYRQADFFIEASDWIVWQLTGKQTRNACAAGYKALWHKKDGYPDEDFFGALDVRLTHVVKEKLNCPVSPLGGRGGFLTKEMAQKAGLKEGTPVAVGIIDAHVCVPSVKIGGPKKMLAIMGTSTCHMLLSDKEVMVEGMCGVVEDGILPGYFGYEAGQGCVGDHFEWFVKNCLPSSYLEEAEHRNMDIYRLMQEKAERLKPGESGLVALDWWNGNRSVLMNAHLTGMIVGMHLATRPEEIYRALIEATAFGTRVIIEAFEKAGVPIEEFYAAGGIAKKDPITMQIYADVIKKPIHISGSREGGALGAAIFGSVAAGAALGGYDSIDEAAQSMGKLESRVYTPQGENSRIYDSIYKEYLRLYHFFGRDDKMMERLREIRLASQP